jgi:hypothetical protein
MMLPLRSRAQHQSPWAFWVLILLMFMVVGETLGVVVVWTMGNAAGCGLTEVVGDESPLLSWSS